MKMFCADAKSFFSGRMGQGRGRLSGDLVVLAKLN